MGSAINNQKQLVRVAQRPPVVYTSYKMFFSKGKTRGRFLRVVTSRRKSCGKAVDVTVQTLDIVPTSTVDHTFIILCNRRNTSRTIQKPAETRRSLFPRGELAML